MKVLGMRGCRGQFLALVLFTLLELATIAGAVWPAEVSAIDTRLSASPPSIFASAQLTPEPKERLDSTKQSQAKGNELPHLPEGTAQNVAKGERFIDEVIAGTRTVDEAELQKHLKAADDIVTLRSHYQGETWWETVNARWRTATLGRWTSMTASERMELQETLVARVITQDLVKAGQYQQGLRLLESSCDVFNRLLGSDNPYRLRCLHDRAVALYREDAYERAESALQELVTLNTSTFGEHHPDYAVTLGVLALIQEKKGDTLRAKSLLNRHLDILKSTVGIKESRYLTGLNNLGLLLQETGEFLQAELVLRQAVQEILGALGEADELYAISLNNLGLLAWRLGKHRDAESLFQKTLKLKRDLGLERDASYGTTLGNLALVHIAMGQYVEAEPLARLAVDIYRDSVGEEDALYANSLNNLALLYSLTGRYSDSEPLSREAVRILRMTVGEQSDMYVRSLNTLAMLYVNMGQYGDAAPLLETVVRLAKSIVGDAHPTYALALSNLAITSLHLRDEQVAAQLLLGAASAKWRYMTNAFPGLSVREQRQFLGHEGFVEREYYWPLFSEPDHGYGQLALQAELLTKHLVVEASRQESVALRTVLVQAPPAWRTSWQERDSLRRQYAALALQDLMEDVGQGHALLAQRPVDPQHIRQLAERIDGLEQELRRENPTYAEAAQLQEISVDHVASGLRADQALIEYVQFRAYDEQTKQLGTIQHYGVYILRGDQTPVVAIDLGEAAPIDAAVAQIHRTMRALIDRSKELTPSRKQLRQSEAELAETAATLRTLVWTPIEEHLKRVKRVYVAPEGQLSLIPFEIFPQKSKQGEWRYLVEDRELVYVNTGRDLARLAMTTKLSLEQAPESSGKPTAVLVGNPAFGAKPREVAQIVAGLPPLPAQVVQVDEVSGKSTLGVARQSETARHQIPRTWGQYTQLDHLLKKVQTQLQRTGWDVTTLTQVAAVEEALLHVQAPRILQIATHGYLLDHVDTSQGGWDNPLLRSMLILAGANEADPQQRVFYRVGKDLLTEAETQQRELSNDDLQQTRLDIGDGILTAYEVTGMNLQGTELVNLTACETGLGEVTPDGVIGLRQAFFLAGARALTTSLWEVPVEETTQQIEAFYTHWLGDGKRTKPKPRYAAFHETQLEALAHARQQYGVGHPFFWAGTIYLGDPGDLPTPSPRHSSQPKLF